LSPRVGIVVPTLGTRKEYLLECLRSIKNAGTGEASAYVVLVAPESFDCSEYKSLGLVHGSVYDPGQGLAAAINAGFSSLPDSIEYINWLGDDDLLTANSLDFTSSFLDQNPASLMSYGACDYINSSGEVVWVNKSGSFAVSLLRFGPDLIPQPGALFRRSAFWQVGGLDASYKWAFDFDLFLKISKIGRVSYLGKTLASFRWHPESLSVEFRKMSVAEASQVRVSHLPRFLRPISFVWEHPVRLATLIAGNRLTKVGKKKANSA
jgi:glycosyltransferase involved in cell wall biosynthesis